MVHITQEVISRKPPSAVVPDDERTCKACRWSRPGEASLWCRRKELLLWSPVLGYQASKCDTNREQEERCGPKGKLWQPVEPVRVRVPWPLWLLLGFVAIWKAFFS